MLEHQAYNPQFSGQWASTRQSSLGIKPNSTSFTCPYLGINQVTKQLNVFVNTVLPPLLLRQRSLQMQLQFPKHICKASPEQGCSDFTTHQNQHSHFIHLVKAKLTL